MTAKIQDAIETARYLLEGTDLIGTGVELAFGWLLHEGTISESRARSEGALDELQIICEAGFAAYQDGYFRTVTPYIITQSVSG